MFSGETEKRKKLKLNKMPTLELKNIMLEIKSTVQAQYKNGEYCQKQNL